MSEVKPEADRRRPTPASVTGTAAYGLTTGLLVAFAHWIFKCVEAHHVVPPDDALIEMAAFALAPTIHLIIKIMRYKLRQWAGPGFTEEEESK